MPVGLVHSYVVRLIGSEIASAADLSTALYALQRPVNKRQYESADTFECAAAYDFGIAKAQAFVDGNKRTAFVTYATFLSLSGWHFVPEAADGVAFMLGPASGEVSEERFMVWLQRGSTEIKQYQLLGSSDKFALSVKIA